MISIGKYIPDDETAQALIDVYFSGHLVQGKRVEEFENKFAEMSGAEYGVAVSNGTVALQMMLDAQDVWGMDDYVITNPLSFIATGNAIRHVSANPYFVDVNEETGLLDTEQVEEAIEYIQSWRGSRAFLMPVDLHGQFDPIQTEENIPILRDSCQAHGIKFQGDAAAYSFHASKNATSGEGGMILTNDGEFADHLRLLRNHGMSAHYEFALDEAYNARLTDLQAAIGIKSLEKLEEANTKRKFLAEQIYNPALENTGYRTPPTQDVYHHYMIRHPKRDEIVAFLRQWGIDARLYYPQLLTDAMKNFASGNLPNATKISQESFAIPVHENLPEKDIQYIITVLEKADKYVN